MAQTITVPLFGHFIIAPDNKLTLADQTATSAALQPASPCKWMFAVVCQKTFTLGTGTVGPIYILEAADDSGFTTNLRRCAEEQVTVRETGNHTLFLIGVAPDGAKAFWRVRLVLNGTDTAAYDAILYGAP